MQATQSQNNAAAAAAIANSMASLGLPPSISVSVTVKGSDNSSAPMDLSGGLAKPDLNGGDQEDSGGHRKRKVDDSMPPPGKEKKRRKLDEIVLGLSAAKGGSGGLFSSPRSSSQGPKASTSSDSNPLGLSFPRSSGITIMPCSKDKDDKYSKESVSKLAAHVQAAEAQALFLSRLPGVSTSRTNSAEAPRISIEPLRNSADKESSAINKLPDFLLHKLDSYAPTHEDKVSKWLTDQQGITPERPISPDVELPDSKRRRKPRVDPAMLDWNRLNGDEHVSVINRLTGKKITGTKAPKLHSLAQWLLDNPMFDVDPKWSDLVKEKGNLPGDLHRRVAGSPSVTLTSGSSTSAAAAAAAAALSGMRSSSSSLPNDKKRSAGRSSTTTTTSSSGRTGNASSALPSASTSASASTSGLNLANFAGLNPSFLSSLPLGLDPKNPLFAAFDPKNPLFGALDPKTAALFGASLDPKNNPLAGIDPKNPLLSSLDPKNPLSMFGGFPGLAGLGGLGNLGNLGNLGALGNLGSMNNPLFSNLAGFMPELATSSAATTSKSSSSTRREDKGKKPA